MKRLYPVLIIIILLTGLKFASYYSGFYTPTKRDGFQLGNFTLPALEAASYEDVYNKTTGGVALFDLAHENSYDPDELNVLLTRVVARNYTVKYLRDKDEMNKTLRGASTFIVTAPKKQYTEEEITLVEDFVRENGTLLLLDDPSRESKINLLSLRLGIVFNRDYLYNLAINDGNYRYVFFTDFKESNITIGLSKVALYVAESITGDGLLLSDTNTYSSLETEDTFSPVVTKDRILAIGDITFFLPHYNAAYDNKRFISNIADFITSSSRVIPLEEEEEEEKSEGNETA
jgi:hypothetical protein